MMMFTKDLLILTEMCDLPVENDLLVVLQCEVVTGDYLEDQD